MPGSSPRTTATPSAWKPRARRPPFSRTPRSNGSCCATSSRPCLCSKRLLSRRRLAEVYQATQSRELPDRNRRRAPDTLRRRFAESTSEERVELILRTEGRALAALAGLSLDAATAGLLCARTLTSLLLVEKLARWPATPPAVIAPLLKQPMVLRTPQPRTLLRRHPNRPASEK